MNQQVNTNRNYPFPLTNTNDIQIQDNDFFRPVSQNQDNEDQNRSTGRLPILPQRTLPPIQQSSNLRQSQPQRRITVNPVFESRRKVCHFQGYLWGKFANMSQFKASLLILQIFFNLLFLIMGIYNYNPENKEKSYVFWLAIITINILGGALSFIDLFFHSKYGLGSVGNMLVVTILDILFWLFQLMVLFSLESKINFTNFYYLLLFCDLIANCCCFGGRSNYSSQKDRDKVYYSPLHFIWNVMRMLVWMRAFKVFDSTWILPLLPIYIISYLATMLIILTLFAYAITILFCSFRCDEFKKSLPTNIGALYFTVIFIIVSNLDEFEKSGEDRVTIFWCLMINLFIAFVACCFIVRPKTFIQAGQEHRALRQASLRQQSIKNTRPPRNQTLVKRYLSFMQVGATLFSENKDPNKEFKESNDLCVICFDMKPNTIYFPCLHGGICVMCSRDVMKTKKSCPFCRKKLDKIVVYEKDKEGKMFEVEEIKS